MTTSSCFPPANPSVGAPAPRKGVDYYQTPVPPGWRLEDEAVLPNGRHVTGTKARVYHLLALSARRSHRWPIGRHHAPAGWVPTWVLREAWAGGSAGDRRARDLREAGVNIEGKPFENAGDDPTASWIWRLAEGSTAAAGGRIPPNKPNSASAPVSTVPAPALRLNFYAGCDRGSKGFPIIDLATSKSVLAPASDQDPAAYREQLLAAWRNGELLAELHGAGELHFLFQGGREDLAEVLATALCKLGATRA